uniref:60S ribosomal protein L38 n=1 Tax=Strongyloides stercoralis TaxID=6248 RepID=A0A0K0EBZ9_STRER
MNLIQEAYEKKGISRSLKILSMIEKKALKSVKGVSKEKEKNVENEFKIRGRYILVTKNNLKAVKRAVLIELSKKIGIEVDEED